MTTRAPVERRGERRVEQRRKDTFIAEVVTESMAGNQRLAPDRRQPPAEGMTRERIEELLPQDAPEEVLKAFRCKFGCVAPCQNCDAMTQNYYRKIRAAILRLSAQGAR